MRVGCKNLASLYDRDMLTESGCLRKGLIALLARNYHRQRQKKATFNEIVYIKWKTVYAKTNGATYIVVIEISALLIAHLRLENGEKKSGPCQRAFGNFTRGNPLGI